ncbi:hypothetical protein [Pantoea sp.]|uniref:hypothetical protein n=1 Tax=Pantoea sp. TaxID=69393 RepID=UPI0031D854EE
MKITQSTIQQLVITDVKSLDPVKVMIENIQPGVGNITITCFGKSWTSYWGAMSDQTIQEFFVDCNDSYLINCLDRGIRSMIDGEDNEANIQFVKAEICRQRRERDIERLEAREWWDEAEDAVDIKDLVCSWHSNSTLCKLFGDEPWHANWPSVPNPDYEYLERIVQVVREAIKQTLAVPA